MKAVSLVGREELQLVLNTHGCRGRRVELCWKTGEILTSAPPQVELFAVGSTEQESCTEHIPEDVRVFSLEPANRGLHRNQVQRCGLSQGRVLCFLEW